MLVAVYGTLKEWFYNHYLIKDFKKVWEDYIKFEALEDCGFPCVKFNDKSDKEILVELYEVDTEEWMERLDRLEWVPTLYHRLYTKTVSGKDICVYEYTDDIEWVYFHCIEEIDNKKYNRVGSNNFL